MYALRGGDCPDWIVPSGMQCKAQIALHPENRTLQPVQLRFLG
ncbi:MAG: hypothetical protein WC091_25830 [Sulfuricellaceae bacterium]